MLRYDLPDVTAKTRKFLKSKQDLVDAQIGREAQYALATSLFKSKNNAAFNEVREKLDSGGPKDGACYYCERDRSRDIEHIWPKRHYPQQSFEWSNYVFACTVCNQDLKRDTFGIIQGGKTVTFDRALGFDKPIPTGTVALIDVRSEDPLEFLQLDLETGGFVPIGDAVMQLRAQFTRDLFDLNAPRLCRGRRQLLKLYVGFLETHRKAVVDGEPVEADRLREELESLPHPTILAELIRQRPDHDWLEPLIEPLPVAFIEAARH